ncbi:unnamed protein product [Linum trigynum]|uniref:RNase H type-1 domain-containing protein n=1 Tax=Linum trigynum TaxID=586398 RepID=A0AAV2GHZ7_9ROSI
MISWQRWAHVWAALNTDGSVIGVQGVTATCGIVRDSNGRFFRAFAANLGGGSITHAKLAGIVYEFQVASDAGLRQVIL